MTATATNDQLWIGFATSARYSEDTVDYYSMGWSYPSEEGVIDAVVTKCLEQTGGADHCAIYARASTARCAAIVQERNHGLDGGLNVANFEGFGETKTDAIADARYSGGCSDCEVRRAECSAH